MKLILKPYIVENFSVETSKERIDEIESMVNDIPKNLNAVLDIPSDVLDSFKINSKLNPKFWENDKLNPEVKKNLIKIAEEFFEELKLPKSVKIKDILFIGSLANYNWSKYSDIDLHIVVDTSKVEGSDDFKEKFFNSVKALWNQEHDITMFDYPIEIYVQDIKEKLMSTAIYSVKNDKWVLKPDRENFKPNKKIIKKKTEIFIDKLKDIKKDYDDKNYKKVVSKVKKLKDKIKNYRISGLKDGGEFSNENLVFKVLRRTPYMEILNNYKAKAYDELMSVNESILSKLRLLAEANDKYATRRDYYTTLFKIAKAKELYGNDKYWENPQQGQWVGSVIVNIHGRVSKVSTYLSPAGDVRANDLGMRGENPYYIDLKIMAGRGIEHPDTYSPNIEPARTRGGLGSEEFEHEYTMQLPDGVTLENGETKIKFGLPKPGSPASDAHIKAFLIYGDLILDFVKNNMKDKIGYVDTDAPEISKEKTGDEWKYKFDKYKKEMERAAKKASSSPITLDPEKAAEMEKRQAKALAARERILKRQNRS